MRRGVAKNVPEVCTDQQDPQKYNVQSEFFLGGHSNKKRIRSLRKGGKRGKSAEQAFLWIC